MPIRKPFKCKKSYQYTLQQQRSIFYNLHPYNQSVKPKKTPPIAANATLNLIPPSTPATLPAAFGFVVELALAAEPVALPVAVVAEAV